MSKNKDVAAKDAAETAPQEAPVQSKRGPVKQFRIEEVSASVFAREYNGQTYYSVSFTRSYEAEDGEIKYTKNFDPDDLGKLVTVVQQAHEYCQGRSSQQGQNAQ